MTSSHSKFEDQLQFGALNSNLFGSTSDSETETDSSEYEEQIDKLDDELLRNQKSANKSKKKEAELKAEMARLHKAVYGNQRFADVGKKINMKSFPGKKRKTTADVNVLGLEMSSSDEDGTEIVVELEPTREKGKENGAENEDKINKIDDDLLRNQQTGKSSNRNIASSRIARQQTIREINSTLPPKPQIEKAPENALTKTERLFLPHAASIGFGMCRWPPCIEPGTSLAWCKECNWAYIGCQEHCNKRKNRYKCPIGHENTRKGPVRIPLSFSNFMELMDIRNESD